jgi:hypothetical protein
MREKGNIVLMRRHRAQCRSVLLHVSAHHRFELLTCAYATGLAKAKATARINVHVLFMILECPTLPSLALLAVLRQDAQSVHTMSALLQIQLRCTLKDELQEDVARTA